MLNQYPLWKNLLVAGVLLVGLLYALPNIYPQDPIIEVTGTRGEEVGATLQQNLLGALERAQVPIKAAVLKPDRLQIRFAEPEAQLAGQDVVARNLPPEYTHALTLSPGDRVSTVVDYILTSYQPDFAVLLGDRPSLDAAP